MNCLPTGIDWFSIIFSGLLSMLVAVFWSLFLYKLKPNLAICEPEFEIAEGSKTVVIQIKNRSVHTSAINLSMEACVILGGKTFHFAIDRSDFLILPPASQAGNDIEAHARSFRLEEPAASAQRWCKDFAAMLQLLENSAARLRVRVHASHSFSGFGRAFEVSFRLVNNRFKGA